MDKETIEKIDQYYIWNHAIDKNDFYKNVQYHRNTYSYKLAIMAVNYAEALERIGKTELLSLKDKRT